MNTQPLVHTLDLHFLDCPNAIASYLIPHPRGAILIESGPGSTQKKLQDNLAALGYQLEDVTHLLLTHIHLDHAGASGWLSGFGAQVYVHERGYPHLLDPSKLIASATRIYQENMDYLWGEIKPVPEEQLHALSGGEEIQVGSLVFRCLDTPGHANHHLAFLLDEICFSGDVGGVRIKTAGAKHLRVPMPPPEFHPPFWRSSIAKLREENISWIAPTHFGFFEDVSWHLDHVLFELDAVEEWMYRTLPRGLPLDELRQVFISWVHSRSRTLGLGEGALDAFEKANPSGMSADGIKRYWDKYIAQPE
jgi:glyoxylase-like metal-dependent hydrolase (beta-lactamase superfamily II)